MALLLEGDYETNFGTTLASTYWRWVGLGIDVTTTNAMATLYAYVSETAFNQGKQNVGQRQYNIKGAEFGTLVMQTPNGPTMSDALSNAIYDYVVANDPFFATATTV